MLYSNLLQKWHKQEINTQWIALNNSLLLGILSSSCIYNIKSKPQVSCLTSMYDFNHTDVDAQIIEKQKNITIAKSTCSEPWRIEVIPV